MTVDLQRNKTEWFQRLKRAISYRFSPSLSPKASERYRHDLLQQPRYLDPLRLNRFEKRIYSQNGEDGVLAEIFKRIGVADGTFVEIGAGDGEENNTRHLLQLGWHGWWIEGDKENVRWIKRRFKEQLRNESLHLIQNFVTVESVLDLFANAGIPFEFDLLSLDIDRNTYWVWGALSAYRPRVVVVEYNAAYSPEIEWVCPYAAQEVWDGTLNFGASLKAYERLASKRGYCLVGCELAGVNAFFVRSDLCKPELFLAPYTAENHHEPPRYFLAQKRSIWHQLRRKIYWLP